MTASITLEIDGETNSPTIKLMDDKNFIAMMAFAVRKDKSVSDTVNKSSDS